MLVMGAPSWEKILPQRLGVSLQPKLEFIHGYYHCMTFIPSCIIIYCSVYNRVLLGMQGVSSYFQTVRLLSDVVMGLSCCADSSSNWECLSNWSLYIWMSRAIHVCIVYSIQRVFGPKLNSRAYSVCQRQTLQSTCKDVQLHIVFKV